ncbi:MAG TPA: heavy metal translocating P-type ATPase [Bacteroidota bacterium]|nr:heavy metal translocating P-type ATPase [Bacteroidota bacterium]
MESNITETTLHLSDLCCATEEQLIRQKLERKRGVHGLEFDVINRRLRVKHETALSDILQSLNEIGFKAEPVASDKPSGLHHRPVSMLLVSTVASGSLLLMGGIFSWLGSPEILSTGAFILSIVVGGWNIALKALKAVRNRSLDMNFLMALAAIGAIAIGEYAEGAAVIFLFALSLLLESMSVDRSQRAIQSLMKLSPLTARIRRNAVETEVSVEEVAIGETVIIRPGERIPLDGTVQHGSSTIDESSLTGESIPVPKQPGSHVFAGTFNQRGALEVVTTHRSTDSTLARIVHLIEEAQRKKAPSQSFIESFARYYTPAVFLLAIGIALAPPLLYAQPFGDWFYRALVLLVIACPCALVISTPVTIVSALTNAARRGILVKGGKYLELLARVRSVALDKTGTLTQGKPRVTDIVPLNSLSPRELLRIAAALELKSEHHLAGAFLEKIQEEGVTVDDIPIDQFTSMTGRGVRGIIGSASYLAGNHQLIEEMGLCSPDLETIFSRLEAEGKTVVALARDTEVLGVMGIVDPLRSESQKAIQELHALGVENITMLTGDNRGTAEALAKQVNLHETKAELLPDQKLAVISDLQRRYGVVAMVGDGINDAPALASADIGIAMGGVGSDTALETADVVLMNDDLSKLPYSITLGKRALRIIKQNIVVALLTKAVFLMLGVFGMTSLWLAILADDGATLVVILNSLRLLKHKELYSGTPPLGQP